MSAARKDSSRPAQPGKSQPGKPQVGKAGSGADGMAGQQAPHLAVHLLLGQEKENEAVELLYEMLDRHPGDRHLRGLASLLGLRMGPGPGPASEAGPVMSDKPHDPYRSGLYYLAQDGIGLHDFLESCRSRNPDDPRLLLFEALIALIQGDVLLYRDRIEAIGDAGWDDPDYYVLRIEMAFALEHEPVSPLIDRLDQHLSRLPVGEAENRKALADLVHIVRARYALQNGSEAGPDLALRHIEAISAENNVPRLALLLQAHHNRGDAQQTAHFAELLRNYPPHPLAAGVLCAYHLFYGQDGPARDYAAEAGKNPADWRHQRLAQRLIHEDSDHRGVATSITDEERQKAMRSSVSYLMALPDGLRPDCVIETVRHAGVEFSIVEDLVPADMPVYFAGIGEGELNRLIWALPDRRLGIFPLAPQEETDRFLARPGGPRRPLILAHSAGTPWRNGTFIRAQLVRQAIARANRSRSSPPGPGEGAPGEGVPGEGAAEEGATGLPASGNNTVGKDIISSGGESVDSDRIDPYWLPSSYQLAVRPPTRSMSVGRLMQLILISNQHAILDVEASSGRTNLVTASFSLDEEQATRIIPFTSEDKGVPILTLSARYPVSSGSREVALVTEIPALHPGAHQRAVHMTRASQPIAGTRGQWALMVLPDDIYLSPSGALDYYRAINSPAPPPGHTPEGHTPEEQTPEGHTPEERATWRTGEDGRREQPHPTVRH